MKNWLKKKSNLGFLVLLGFFLVQQVILRRENSQQDGLELKSESYPSIDSSQEVIFPPPSGNAIAIFWATWCAPCKFEMARLNESVVNGNIPSHKIFAINSFDSLEDQRRFQREKKYSFTFIHAPGLGDLLGVRVTPTTLFIKERKIEDLSTGLSFIGIWKAEAFL